MARPLGYICEVRRDALEPQVWVALLASRAAGITDVLAAAAKTPDAAHEGLRKVLAERTGRKVYPIGEHLLPEGYYCSPCKLELNDRAACSLHRSDKHGLKSALP